MRREKSELSDVTVGSNRERMEHAPLDLAVRRSLVTVEAVLLE